MLVPNEGSNIESDRPASAHRTEGVGSALPANAPSRPAMIGFNMNSIVWWLPKRGLSET